ncbi:uncharacterized protein CLAFUR5_05346 [Fulvia fulva]|uniref:DUF6604 domain-containing protein n=1 Tax=Passalora fulva TaxID=5499 RepID=A0A9Q8LG64_PASFU|nr:uncharacterized protein CLAFUR5_05346 [Fulvia fulva]KAK4617066.1 hypothetical protein CLAFUR0_10743 [Fulvia fulva]UJO16826.1 hypothetical protein CLAFUR5_05346 [Fulvia fulva]
MADSTFSSRYRKYKQDTHRLIRWLYSIGRTFVQPLGTTLSVKDLLTLAHCICSAVPIIDIPLEIEYAVRDAIAGRVEASRSYASLLQSCQASTLLAEQNARHEHFIRVLRQILQFIQEARSRLKIECNARKIDDKGKYVDPRAAADILRSLDLEAGRSEECDDGGLPDYDDRDLKLDRDDGDFLFELWTFLQDQRDLREHVRKVWDRYHKCNITFAVATRVTESAFGIIREMCDAFTLSSYEQLTACLGLALFSSSTGPMFFTLATDATGSRCNSIWTQSWQASFSEHPFAQALDAVAESVSALAIKGSPGDDAIDGVFLDEFTRALVVFKQKQIIPMSAAFQAQIYMDFFEALGGDAGLPLLAPRRTHEIMDESR